MSQKSGAKVVGKGVKKAKAQAGQRAKYEISSRFGLGSPGSKPVKKGSAAANTRQVITPAVGMTSGEESVFAVFNRKTGRAERGIARVRARIVGDEAFVLRTPKSVVAEVIPAANVFNTYEEAERYLAGDGVLRWVAGIIQGDNDHHVPTLFQARCVFFNYSGRYGVERRTTMVRVSDGAPVKMYSEYCVSYHETKKAADVAYAKLWRAEREKVAKYNDDYQKQIDAIDAVKPRRGLGLKPAKKAAKS